MNGSRTMIAVLALAAFAAAAQATTYNVGPGQTYTNIGDVPLENLVGGDVVNIYYRAAPYYEKFCLSPNASPSNPVTIHGVPDGSGNLPVLDGQNATTRLALDYAGDERSVIHIGATAIPNNQTAKGLVIENLDIKSGRTPYTYTCDAGTTKSYLTNAASIRIVDCDGVVIRNCVIRDSHNGLITSPTTINITFENCYIWGNGRSGSVTEHNVYTETKYITAQYNHFGSPLVGSTGNNFKDRSAGTICRYNWIEDGSRQLDLVDATTTDLRGDPKYGKDFVYGNVLYEKTAFGNNQIVHYGGDSGTTSYYRPGPLHFYNNTVVSLLTGGTALFRPQDDEVIEGYNNIVHTPNGGLQINAVTNGTVTYYYNWLQTGYNGTGAIDGGNNITGTAPGFVSLGSEDFHLTSGSACRDAGMALPSAVLPDNNVTMQYVKHQDSEARPSDSTFDIGAYEYDSGVIPDLNITTTSMPDGRVATAYSQQIQATGGVTPYSWSLYSGALPSGLSLSSGGLVSGTPTASGTSYFTVQVQDSQNPADSDTQALSIVVYSDLNITTTSLPNGKKGQAYSQTLQATGGKTPYTWSKISGSLPNGLSLNTSTGVISGTPRKAGTSNFTVRCTDSQSPADTDDQALSIVITP